MDGKRIDIRNLTLTLDLHGPAPRRLVDDLSLTVEAGRVLALVGESGAGKSMTSLAVMGLLPPGVRRSGGDVFVNGRAVGEMTEGERRRLRGREVAMIMQNPMSAFDPLFTVAAHFRETMERRGASAAAAREAALRALDEVGLPDPAAALDAYPFQLSGGMLQRAMIALALVNNPSFLIADEATTDLDPALQKRILRFLRDRIRGRGLGLLVVTHDLGVAARLADDIAVLRRGRLVEQGSLREVFAAPKADCTKALLAAHRELDGEKFQALAARLRGTAGQGGASAE